MNEEVSKPQEKREIQRFDEVKSFFKTLVVFLIIAIVLRASVVEAFKIPSGSMIPTLKIGDHILVSKFAYGFRIPFMRRALFQYATPKRGDIVVFTRPDEEATLEDESGINIIKRVVGLPGDLVEVRDTKVYINNVYYQEPYSRWGEGGLREGNFGPERVPDNHIFLLGDNRDHSKDSRFWQNPYLDLGLVKGRAILIYWSWDSVLRIGTLIR